MGREVTVLLMINADLGGPEAVDSFNTIGHFGFFTVLEVNVITKYSLNLKSRSFGFCQRELTAIVTGSYCLLKENQRLWRTESIDSGNKIGLFGFCTLVEVNVITKVLYDFKE